MHLCRLDIRQESVKHSAALDAITTYLGLGSYKCVCGGGACVCACACVRVWWGAACTRAQRGNHVPSAACCRLGAA